MFFNSLTFIFVFLPLVLLAYYFSPKIMRNFVLLVASLIFCGWSEPIHAFLMIFFIMLAYFSSLLICKYGNQGNASKKILIITLIVNLGLLVFFKYSGFIMGNINMMFGLKLRIAQPSVPAGMSFYTLQIMSYVIDVYLNKVNVQKNIIDLGAYVTMFPKLTAGPIVKYKDMASLLENRRGSLSQFASGVERFIQGLGKKVLIANNMGCVWTTIRATSISEMSVASAWLGMMAFTFQIYFDLSGYSDMAIGLGKMLGFEFRENFNYPYMAKSVTEFWRRWHVSLGSWFNEYMYIPLGGSRGGLLKQIRNFILVWFAIGLWHGAGWNFAFWGLYFGLLVFMEKIFLGKLLAKVSKHVAKLYVLLAVMIGWVFFGIDKLSECFKYLKIMFGFSRNVLMDNTAIYYFYANIILFAIAIICATPIMANFTNKFKQKCNARGALILSSIHIFILILSTAYLVNESLNQFLYLRF